MIEGKLDLKSFFKKGYCVAKVDKSVSDHLLQVIQRQPFVEGDGVYASENFRAPLISKWESSKIIPSENKDAPIELLDFYSHAKEHQFFRPFIETMGSFTQGCPMINRFRNGDGMVWHTDSLDATAITCCLYLTPDEFTLEDGGWLGVGRYNGESVDVFERILPNHGTLVLINNFDPTNQHRVDPMRSNKERNTLLFHLGYVEHTLTKARLKDIRNVVEP